MNDLLRYVILGLHQQIAAKEEALGSGSATDFGQYRETVGEISGLKEAVGLIKDANQKYMEADDDEHD